MVIVRKVPAQVQRTSTWLSAELDLADQLAALGFFSSDDDALSSTSSSSNDATVEQVRTIPKKRYGGVSSRRQPSVSAGLIRDVGRKRVGWRRQRRLDNEMTILHGRPDVEIDFDKNLEGVPEMQVELLVTPPSAPLASLFRDSDAFRKWQEFDQQTEDEQQKQLTLLFQSEQRFATSLGAGFGSDEDEDNSKPQNFRKALGAAKRQLRKVGRPLCRQLRRLASPALMASVENELLARMGDAAVASVAPTAPTASGGGTTKSSSARPVTCVWETASVFKAYTERITLDALCRYYDYQLIWPNTLVSVQERDEHTGGGCGGTSEGEVDDTLVSPRSDDEVQAIEIRTKNWRWPPVRLANIFFLNQEQQHAVF